MGLNKDSAAKRMTAVPSDFTATLTATPSEGKRNLFEYSADKYGTVKVRAYMPDGVNVKAIDGHVLDFTADGTLAEDADDNTRRKQVVARSVLMLTKAGKVSGYGTMSDDYFDATVLIVVTVPNWANVDSITLAV